MAPTTHLTLYRPGLRTDLCRGCAQHQRPPSRLVLCEGCPDARRIVRLVQHRCPPVVVQAVGQLELMASKERN